MKKVLFFLTLAAASVFASSQMTTNQAYLINRASKINRDSALGTMVFNAMQGGTKGTYDFSVQGGAQGNKPLLDIEGLPVKLPPKAIIKKCYIDVVTAPLSVGLATIAVNSKAVGDLKVATAKASLTANTLVSCIPDGTTTNAIRLNTSSETTLGITIGASDLTAGKINVWVDWLLTN